MPVVTLAHHAMASRFEMVLRGGPPARLRAAGEEAFAEIDRIEARLSIFRPHSEVSRLNAKAATEPVPVSAPLFNLLLRARQLFDETGGAFDVTVAPLMQYWGFRRARPASDAGEWERARRVVGMQHVELDASSRTVAYARPGVMVDLGAIGKGFAIDRAAEILRDAGVEHALIHGGTSTVYAMGRGPGGKPWRVGIDSGAAQPSPGSGSNLAAVVLLDNASLSVSAVWGRTVTDGERTRGHVIDPRTGRPTEEAVLAACVLPSAAESDAISTALLTMGRSAEEWVARHRPGLHYYLIPANDRAGAGECRAGRISVARSSAWNASAATPG